MKREFLDEFLAAKWRSPEETRAFAEKIREGMTPEDVIALLDILTGKRIGAGTPAQEARVRIFQEVSEKVAGKGLFEACLKAIKVDDKHLRPAVASLLANVQTPQLRPKICDLMKTPDIHLRKTVVQVLRKINDPTVLRHVGELFRDRNFPGRAEAIDLAGTMPGVYSLELLKEAVVSGKSAEKVKAIKYLLSPPYVQGNPRSVLDAIRPALHDPDETVLAEAIVSFARLCTEEEYFESIEDYLFHENLRLVRASVEGLRNFSSERVVAVLERKLFTGPNLIRLAVLDSVEHNGTSSVNKVLLKALEHRNNIVRERASELLTRLTKSGKVKVADALLWLFRSKDPNVKQMAVTLSATISPDAGSELWGEVLAQLRTEDWWVRQQLVGTLVGTAGEGLVPHITRLLRDPSDIFRRFLVEVLLGLKSQASIEVLVQTAFHDPNWLVREKAIQALAEIGAAPTIPAVLKIAVTEPEFRVVALEALCKMGAKSSLPHIVKFLGDENPDVRMAALGTLDAFDNRNCAAQVVSCTKDPDINVRQRAKDIAQKWNLACGPDEGAKGPSLSLLDKLLIGLRNADGDDLILLPDNTPYMKKHGKTVPLIKNAFSHQQIKSIIGPLLTEQQKENLKNLQDVDFSYQVRSEGLRFRVNIFISRTGISAVFRIIKGDIWNLRDLGLPPIVSTFGDFKNGLVLVGGPTGSGKSTTLATIIADINKNSRRHVISIEDPIEAVHRSQMGLVTQREVGVHTPTFNHALRMTLREDPDVILVGEMRDLDTIKFAVSAAETGHLVFGTVHTVSADASVDRLINAYPAEVQEQVRSMLADSLRAVLCQYLIRHKEKNTRVLATEVMLNNNAISNLIRKGKTYQISSVIVTSKEQQMQLMDQSLLDLYKQGMISADEAYLKARNKADFENLVGGDSKVPSP